MYRGYQRGWNNQSYYSHNPTVPNLPRNNWYHAEQDRPKGIVTQDEYKKTKWKGTICGVLFVTAVLLLLVTIIGVAMFFALNGGEFFYYYFFCPSKEKYYIFSEIVFMCE